MTIRSASLVLLTAISLSAADVELSLASGQTIVGEIVKDGEDAVVIRQAFATRGGARIVEVSFKRTDILHRKELPSLLQRYEERKARTPDTVPEQCTLAQWCSENCLRELAHKHATHVLTLDPDNTWAKRTLDSCGYLYLADKGQWVDEVPYLKANNLAKLDGKLVPAEYAESRIALSKAVTARDQLTKLVDEKKTIVRDKGAAADGNEAKAKQSAAAVEAVKKALDQAQQTLETAQTTPSTKPETPAAHAKRLDDLAKKRDAAQAKLSETKKAADAAKRLASIDKSQVESAKGSLTDLEASLTKAKSDVVAAAAKLPKDDPAVIAAVGGTAPPTGAAAGTPSATDNKPKTGTTSDPPVTPPVDKPVRRLRPGGGD
ncbi:MAG: hypothetical protein AAB263_14230 [Planctomycetota bacterium]